MRVIAGAAKGRILRSPPTRETRPITDRAKESLFAILGPRLTGCRFLDLFAGTGGVGIEALSRGCGEAVFVERSPRAVANIRYNLDLTRLGANARVIPADVFSYLRGSPSPFGIIFVAPPQWRGLWTRTIQLIDREPGWLDPDGLVVVQHDPSESTELGLASLRVSAERTYARVRFTFFRPADQRPPGQS